MNNIVFLIMRRMRLPLLTLLVVYALSVLGLTLIPGRDADGNLWYMDFFHAFYFVSFMSTTIGFGEIPYEFTDAQRLWVTLSMYITVISWLYAIGTIIALLRDKLFQRAIAERLFAHRVRGMCEPFYLICGYGETGQKLVGSFTDHGQHVVVLDWDENKINQIHLQNLRDYVPALTADARVPLHLQEAGLPHQACAGVVAVTDDNETNLKIAITSKLLHPDIRVIARADSSDIGANMASFGTDWIIDPFETFSRHLSRVLRTPCLYLLGRWLGGDEGADLEEPLYPPRDGPWLVCGYGRFGKAVVDRLNREGMQAVVVEADPALTGEPPAGYVLGQGTEAETLVEAGIQEAVGIVAGTNDDTNNLSIVMTARELRPDLFVILRQNDSENRDLIQAVGADMVMHPSAIIAEQIRLLFGVPMLAEFFQLASQHDNAWACELVSRLSGMVTRYVPVVREVVLSESRAPAAVQAIGAGAPLTLGELLSDPWDRARKLPCLVLMLCRGGEKVIMPDFDHDIRLDDELLVAGAAHGHARFAWNLGHHAALDYVRSGQVRPRGWLWRTLRRTPKN
jgi:Trk K+ transport system NAD-binding subunit